MTGGIQGYQPEAAIQFTALTVPLYVVAVVGAVLAVVMLRYWRQATAYPLIGVFGGSALWAGSYALEITSRTAASALFWQNVHYTASTLVPVAILVLALQVTDREGQATSLQTIEIATIPAVTISLLWAGSDVWATGYSFDPVAMPPLTAEWGWWYLVYISYQVLLTIAAIALFGEYTVEQAAEGIGPPHLLLVATVMPTIGTVLYVSGYASVDYGAYAFLLSGLLVLGAVFYLPGAPDLTAGADPDPDLDSAFG